MYCLENPLRADLHPSKKMKLNKKSKAAKHFVKETENESKVQDTPVFVASESKEPTVNVEKNTAMTENESGDIQTPEKKKKISRDSYTCQYKAHIIMKYLEEKERDPNLSYADFSVNENIKNKCLVIHWVAKKEITLRKALEGCVLKKLRLNPNKNPRHAETHKYLHEEFIQKRKKGKKVSFMWLLITGKKLLSSIHCPHLLEKELKCSQKNSISRFDEHREKSRNQNLFIWKQ